MAYKTLELDLTEIQQEMWQDYAGEICGSLADIEAKIHLGKYVTARDIAWLRKTREELYQHSLGTVAGSAEKRLLRTFSEARDRIERAFHVEMSACEVAIRYRATVESSVFIRSVKLTTPRSDAGWYYVELTTGNGDIYSGAGEVAEEAVTHAINAVAADA